MKVEILRQFSPKFLFWVKICVVGFSFESEKFSAEFINPLLV